MKISPVYKLIQFDEFSATPKYRQLANAIIHAVEKEKIEINDVLPSINELSAHFEISRDTAEKGYKYLKSIGVVGSVPGKGYFILSTDVKRKIKIFLMFNKLSAHKKIIYDALVNQLGDAAAIDFYIYNNNFSLFKRLLENSGNDYHYYVIIPHFIEGGELANQLINAIPKDKLILLDKLLPGITGTYGAVYENFEKDIYNALVEALPLLHKYHSLHINFPQYTYHPQEILSGFNKFCQDFAFHSKVVPEIQTEVIKKGTVYINLMEEDLVTLLENIRNHGFEIGKEVGVISYNETPLKKFILNGITTISTDFQMMGEKTADLILHNCLAHFEANFYLNIRASL